MPAQAVQLDQPTNVQVSPGRRAIQVAWDAPPEQDPPNPVDHYVATTFPDGKTCESPTTACTILGLQAGVDYEVEVVACPTADDFEDCSEPSTRSAVVTPGPPGVPAAPTAAYTGTGGQVAVSWTDPSTEGAGIESFRVTVSPLAPGAAGTCTAVILEAAANTCVFTGLTPGTSYTFKVIANGIGTTGSSAASAASTPIVVGPPGTIAAPTVTRVDDNTVTVAWTTPVGGGPVANYTILSNNQGALTVPGTCEDGSGDRTCNVDVADPSVSHIFQVRANGLVIGASSGTSTSAAATAITPGAPGTPGTPDVDLTDANEVTLTWTAPSGGGTVDHYTIQSNHQGDMTVPGTCEDDAGDLTCVVTGLNPALTYTFRVTAVGPHGSTQSAASSSVIAAAPGVPGTPAVSLTGPGTATVTWTAPTTGGPATSYVLTSNDPSAVIPGTCGDDPAIRSCAVTGLDPDIAYTFQVQAVGELGDEDSAASAPIFPDEPGVPGTPAVDVTGSGAVTVTWTAPSTGGPVTSYVLTSSDPDAVIPDTCGDNPGIRSCAVTGLTPTLASTFQVKAVGQLGDENSVASAAIFPAAPGTPGTPAVDVTGSGAVTVTWTAPTTGGPVVGYVLTSSDPDAVIPGDCGDNPGVRTCAVTGLTPTLASTFQVQAVGDFGTANSAVSPAIRPAAPGTPGTPVVDVTGSGAVTVTWTAPSTGGPVVGYVLTSSDPDADVPDTCGDDPAVLTCNVTGLTATLASTFQVQAVGDFGTANSAASAAIRPAAPGTPGTPVVDVTGSGAVTVTWTAPSTGGPVVGYVLTSSDPDADVPDTCGDDPAVRTCNVTGLTPTLASTFQVQAVGDFSTANSAPSAAIFPAEPGAPGTPSVTVTGPGTATVTWTAPTTGGTVTGYVLTSNEASAVIPDACGDDPAVRTCTVTGLEADTSYTFRVQAIGDFGSANSPVSPAILPDEPGVPGTPSVVLSEPNTATVSWTAPGTGGPVTSYTLTSNQGSLVVPADCGDDAGVRSCVIEGLNPALSYTFRVQANGPLGQTLSVASAAVIPDEPGAPGTPSVVLSEPNTVTITWTAPSTGGPVTSYTLTSNQGSLVVPADCGDDPGVRSCVIEGLNPALSYTFRVQANGPLGTHLSPASAAVIADEPGTPGTPTVENGVAGTVVVSWTAPEPGSGGPVTGYSVTSLPDVTAPAGCTTENVLTCVFTGLDPTKSYTFLVTAHGPLGDTNSAASSEPITPGAPGAPGTPTVVVAGENTVRVSWTPSPSTGGPVTGYTVTSDPAVTPPADCTLTEEFTCDFTGLDADTSYTFLVTANGSAGNTPSVARSAPITPAAPGAPGTAKVEVVSADTVKVSWTAPTAGGPVTGYTVSSDPSIATPLACVNVQGLSCNFSGLVQGTSYRFLVTAIGPAGNTPAVALSPAINTAGPGAPGTPEVTLGGPNAVTVTWTAPADGGPVAGYTVTSDPALTAPAECTDVLTLSCTFDNLASGTPYTFRVVATGPLGITTPSSPSEPITPGPPDAPARPTVTAIGIDQVQVTWEAPSAGAGITGYNVQSNPGNLHCAEEAGPTDTSCVVDGVDPDTAYTFRVQAIGVQGSGNSAFSPASVAITPGAVSAPTDVDVVGGDRQISVSWTASANAGEQIAYYQATATPGNADCTTDNSVDTECVITGLTNLTSYTVRVVAVGVDEADSSAPSAPSVRVRPTAGPPGSPTAVRAAPRDGGAFVSWTAPTSVGDGISRYVATATGSPDGNSCITPNATTRNCTITGLFNALDYKITVVAVGRSASGNSAPSAAVMVRPAVPPPTPTGVTATPGASTLVVSFTPGGTAGVANHTATATGGPSTPCTTTTATATSCVIRGVTPGTEYTVTVVANGTVPGLNSPASEPSDEVTALAFPAPALPATTPSSSTITGVLTSSAGASLPLGTETTISGTGYAPHTGITVGIYPGANVLGAAITDETGAFSVTVSIGGVTAGLRAIVAAGMRPTGAVRYSRVLVNVTAAPGLAANRSTVSRVAMGTLPNRSAALAAR